MTTDSNPWERHFHSTLFRRDRAAYRAVRGPNRYVLKVPAAAVQWLRCSTGQTGRRDTNDQKKPARERSSGALVAMLEAAKGLPDLLKARREAMEARWQGEMAAKMA
jgi:hypothetical protein